MKSTARLYLEVDDSCAICGNRGSFILTIHHIDGDPDSNTYDNCIVICWNCHQSHHRDGVPTGEQIQERKAHLIAKTLSEHGVSAMKFASRNESGVVALPFLVYHLVELGYLEEQEEQMEYEDVSVTKRFTITEEGRQLLARWRL